MSYSAEEYRATESAFCFSQVKDSYCSKINRKGSFLISLILLEGTDSAVLVINTTVPLVWSTGLLFSSGCS